MAVEVAMKDVDRTIEIGDQEDLKASKLTQEIEGLKEENSELARENKAVKERITKLEGNLSVMESEKAESARKIVSLEEDKKMLDVVASRAAELETDVSRLQHSLITAEADAIEANKEAAEMKRELEKLKESGLEISKKVEVFEKERSLLLKKLDEIENESKDGKRVGEERIHDLMKKLEVLEGKESDAKAELGKKESEIHELKKSMAHLELVVVRNGEEMVKVRKEKDELEGTKGWLEGLLKKSEERVKEMEVDLKQLVKDLEVSKLVISGFEEKTLNGISGIREDEDGMKGMYGLKLQWPVLAASTGLVVTMGALWYLRTKQR